MKVFVEPEYAIERDSSGEVVRLWWMGHRRRRKKTKSEIREQCARIMTKRPIAWVNKVWLRML